MHALALMFLTTTLLVVGLMSCSYARSLRVLPRLSTTLVPFSCMCSHRLYWNLHSPAATATLRERSARGEKYVPAMKEGSRVEVEQQAPLKENYYIHDRKASGGTRHVSPCVCAYVWRE